MSSANDPSILRIPANKAVALYLVAGHAPLRDIRIRWQAECAPDEVFSILLGLDRTVENLTVGRVSDQLVELVLKRQEAPGPGKLIASNPALFLINSLVSAMSRDSSCSPGQLAKYFNISDREALIHRSRLHYFLSAATQLIQSGRRLPKPSILVACDLESLIPACVLSRHFGVDVIYDAHEFWPLSFDAPPAIARFWMDLEQVCLAFVRTAFTVSPPLASQMSNSYRFPFLSAANTEPILTSHARFKRESDYAENQPTKFLFLGGIARTRGLLPLVRAWHLTRLGSILLIQGPVGDPEYWDQVVEASGRLYGDRILRVPEVPGDKLQDACLAADIGVIPYEPVNINNRFCCPNKLSQYMAAGLPILANKLDYVEHVLVEGNCGWVADFNDAEHLAWLIDDIAGNRKLQARKSTNARRSFEERMNWGRQSVEFYGEIVNSEPSSREQVVQLSGIASSDVPTALEECEKFASQYGCLAWPHWRCFGVPSHKWDPAESRVVRSLAVFRWVGDEYRAEISLPYAADLTAIYLAVYSDEPIEECALQSFNFAGSSGFVDVELAKETGDAFVRWSGNLADRLEVRLKLRDARPGHSTPTCDLKLLSASQYLL